MKDIGKIKRSVTLTNDQWLYVVTCITHVQLQHRKSQENWKQLYANSEGMPEREEAEIWAKSYEEDIEKLEEIRMTIGGDATEEKQAESEKERMV